MQYYDKMSQKPKPFDTKPKQASAIPIELAGIRTAIPGKLHIRLILLTTEAVCKRNRNAAIKLLCITNKTVLQAIHE